MKSQTRSDIGSRFGQHSSFGPQRTLLSSQRVAGLLGSQRRPFVPRKTFTFHGSRRKTNASLRADNASLLDASLGADVSHRRRLTPRPPSPPPHPAKPTLADDSQQPLPLPPPAANQFTEAGAAAAATAASAACQCGSVAAFAVPLLQPQATLVQHMVSGPQLVLGADAAAQTDAAADADKDGATGARSWLTDRPFLAREAYLAGRKRRARRQRRPKQHVSRPFRKIFYSEREGKWIEHRIFESEPLVTNELGGPQPFPPANTARRRRPDMGRPHKVKGRKTSKMREMLPTAFVKGGEKPDQPCRKIDVTDQLRMELYKRNMPVVPTFYQEHIYKFGKPPFRGNPRTH